MKAAIYAQAGGPELFRYVDVACPTPGEGEVLIRVEAISVEGGDVVNRRDLTPESADEVPGYSAAGEIVEVGPGVTGFEIGQKVATFAWKGSHAEMRVAPAAQTFPIPDTLDLKVASTLMVGPGTANWALKLGRLKPGQTVLVLGATGGVGLAAVQLAKRRGARVIGSGTSQAAIDRVRDFGLDDGVVVATGRASAAEQTRELLGGNLVDVVIDIVGGDALVDALAVLRDGGVAVLIGIMGGRQTLIDAGDLLMHRKTVVGCLLGTEFDDPEAQRAITEVFDLAASGELVTPIDAVFPLSQTADAHARAEQRGRIGRVIITPD